MSVSSSNDIIVTLFVCAHDNEIKNTQMLESRRKNMNCCLFQEREVTFVTKSCKVVTNPYY